MTGTYEGQLLFGRESLGFRGIFGRETWDHRGPVCAPSVSSTAMDVGQLDDLMTSQKSQQLGHWILVRFGAINYQSSNHWRKRSGRLWPCSVFSVCARHANNLWCRHKSGNPGGEPLLEFPLCFLWLAPWPRPSSLPRFLRLTRRARRESRSPFHRCVGTAGPERGRTSLTRQW